MKRLSTHKKGHKATSKQDKAEKTRDHYFYIFGLLIFLYGGSQGNPILATVGILLWGYALMD